MKNFIYTTLLVFASLFCQSFGAQNEWPQLLDTTICAKPGETIHMSDFKSQILELLQNREDSIWSECCDVMVELEREPQIAIESKPSTGWPNLDIDKNKVVGVTVTYKRQLKCTNLPRSKEDATSQTSYAMWFIFGDLLSRTETEVPDTASVTTLHKATFVYKFNLAFPDDIPFKIINEDAEDFCFDDKEIWLRVPDEYSLCRLKWEVPYGIDFKKSNDTQQAVILKCVTDDYAYPIVCRAISCSNDTVFDTIQIGKPTPTPKMEDLACIASNETSFDVAVKEPDSRLSYHWIFEEEDDNRTIQFEQGELVEFELSPTVSGVLHLYSTGGCKGSDTVTQILHRSVVAGNIQMQGDTNCVFTGDTLRFVLQSAPQDSLIWKSETGEETLLGNAEFVCNTTGLNTTSFKVSVSNKNCPESVDSNTFNIRKDLEVSIDPNESCISAYTAQTFRAIGNGINPEIFWNGNGVEIDTVIYGKKDSVQLRLTNPGGNNLFVAVMAKECGRESEWDTLVLRPKPEIPKLDTLWKALTPCIPLGLADTIELRVQPQEGVKFRWSILEEEITEFDSNSIPVRVNYKLSDKDAPIPVSVYAYTDGCPNSDTLSEILKATGAGLGPEWHIDSKAPSTLRRTVGFCQYSPDEIQNSRVELDTFAFLWTSSVKFQGSNSLQALQFVRTPLPIDVTCLLTNKRTTCYSYYAQTIAEATTLQNILPPSNDREQFGSINETSEMTYMDAHSSDNSFEGIVLTPNPTQGNTLLYLGNTDIGERTVIEIFTEQGVCLYRQKAKGSMVELPTARFGSGLYLVRVRTGEGSPVVKKLIVQ